MTYSTNENVVDSACHQWIVPDFAAITTPTDVVAASVMLKSSLQNYKSISASIVGSTFQLLREGTSTKQEMQRHSKTSPLTIQRATGIVWRIGAGSLT